MHAVIGRLGLINLGLAMVVAFGIYVIVDGLSRIGKVKGEYSRKAIHITLGIFVATFPIFLNRTEIFVFHGMFFVGLVCLSLISEFIKSHKRALNNRAGAFLAEIFNRYEDVKRWTIGQFLFPLSLLFVVLLYDNMMIYSFSVLMLALADGFAAVIGKAFGKKRYYVPGGYKTYIGSLTFFLIAFTLLGIYVLIATDASLWALIPAAVYAAFLTISEGAIAGGFDNIAVPILTAILLNTV